MSFKINEALLETVSTWKAPEKGSQVAAMLRGVNICDIYCGNQQQGSVQL